MTHRIGYAAAGWTALYGLLKLYWAIGGTRLRDTVGIDKQLWHDGRFVALGLWGTVLLALVGIATALATVRPWGARIPRWVIGTGAWFATVVLALRAAPSLVADALVAADLVVPHGWNADRQRLLLWDLRLWAPFFAVWALLWAATAWRYSRLARHG
jgi:hypothetical protein